MDSAIRFFWAFMVFVLAAGVIAILTSALNEGFKGNPWMIAFAGFFWVFIVGTALIADRRRR